MIFHPLTKTIIGKYFIEFLIKKRVKPMKTKALILFLGAFFFVILQSGCDNSPTETCDEDTTVTVFKPNIYIYPIERIDLSVNITFPIGGKVTESIPEYNTGWNVSVEPNGIINDEFEYLFYECDVPDLFQKEKGWIVGQSMLKIFFESNLNSHGFNESEIRDFTDYWIPKLMDSSYYEIYPQYSSDIEKMIVLNFSKEPDNIFRLFYYIKGRENNEIDISVPKIECGKRNNYFVMEWGVITS